MKFVTMNLLAGVLALSLVACGDNHEHDDDHEHGGIEAEACEHMVEGPATAVTATTDAGSAPDVSEGHRRYDVTLVDVGDGNGGVVSFASAHALDHTFFLSADVDFEVRDDQDAVVDIEATELPFDACDEVVVSHTVPLSVGTYTLHLGPSTETSVSLVAESAEHEHEH